MPSCGFVTMSRGWSGSSMSARTRFASSSRRAVGRSWLAGRCSISAPTSSSTARFRRRSSEAAARLVGSYAEAARARRRRHRGADHEPGPAGRERKRAARCDLGGSRLPHSHPQRDRRGSARVRRCARGGGAADASSGRRRRRRRRVGTGRRRDATRRSGMAAFDRPRLSASDQQAARRRPARTREQSPQHAPRRRGTSTNSILPSLASPSPSEGAPVRSSASSAGGSAATTSNEHSRCSPRRLPSSSCGASASKPTASAPFQRAR